jgi:hypothetical protein
MEKDALCGFRFQSNSKWIFKEWPMATGLSKIPAEALKIGCEVIKEVLAEAFEIIARDRIIPNTWTR